MWIQELKTWRLMRVIAERKGVWQIRLVCFMMAVLFQTTYVCYCNIKLQDFMAEPVQVTWFGANSPVFLVFSVMHASVTQKVNFTLWRLHLRLGKFCLCLCCCVFPHWQPYTAAALQSVTFLDLALHSLLPQKGQHCFLEKFLYWTVCVKCSK